MLNQRRPLRCATRSDDGSALIFVLLVTTIVMIGVTSVLVVTASSIVPARHSQDAAGAMAAAEAGVQDALAWLNTTCPKSGATCSAAAAHESVSQTPGIGGSAERFSWSSLVLGDGLTVRVTSSGTDLGQRRTLVADISSVPSILRFGYYTQYETEGSDLLKSYYPSRTIKIVNSVAQSIAQVSSWTWPALNDTGELGVGKCDALWYDSAGYDTVPGETSGAGRSTIKVKYAIQDSGWDFGVDQTIGAVTRHFRAPCEVTFSSGMQLSGPVYSVDALYLSNSTVGGTGPVFSTPTNETLYPGQSAWSATDSPPNLDQYRRFPLPVGGSTTSVIRSAPYMLQLDTDIAGAASNSANLVCTYIGPTQIRLTDETATVTSPMTPANPSSPCTTSHGAGTGVVAAAVPLERATIIVRNKGTDASAWGKASPGNPLFTSASGGTFPVVGDVTRYPTASTDGADAPGDVYIEGTAVSGVVSIAAEHDITVTGPLTTDADVPTNQYGEPGWTGGGAIDLVATDNVHVYHPVSCKDTSPADFTGNENGYCPNDITGLYPGGINANQFDEAHPSRQYCAMTLGECPGVKVGNSVNKIDADIFALNGSFYADNATRGSSVGKVVVEGGVYQRHRGALGAEWEFNASTTNTRQSSGYQLQVAYRDLEAAGLPYVPEAHAGTRGRAWNIVSVSSA